jgi:hypothetical protein
MNLYTFSVRLTTLLPSVSRLSRQCAILNISQPYRSPRPATGISLLYFTYTFSVRFIDCPFLACYNHYILQSFILLSLFRNVLRMLIPLFFLYVLDVHYVANWLCYTYPKQWGIGIPVLLNRLMSALKWFKFILIFQQQMQLAGKVACWTSK